MSDRSLPNELISLIFDNLVDDGDSRTLARCACISHQFASWCQPLALHQVHLDCWNDKRVQSLSESIKRNPDLASFVKVLDIQISEREPWDTKEDMIWLLSKLNSLTSLRLYFDDNLSNTPASVVNPYERSRESIPLRFALALRRLARWSKLVDLTLYNVCNGWGCICLANTLTTASLTAERVSWVVGSGRRGYCGARAGNRVFPGFYSPESASLHTLDVSNNDASDLSNLFKAVDPVVFASLTHLSVTVHCTAYHHPEFGFTDVVRGFPYNGLFTSLVYPPSYALETVKITTYSTIEILNGTHGLEESEGLVDAGNNMYPHHSWWTGPHTFMTQKRFPALKTVAIDVVLTTIDKHNGRTLPVLPRGIVDELTGRSWGILQFTVRRPS